MPFLKNIQFSHLIKVNGQLKEFNFWKSNGNAETVVTIDTLDQEQNRLIFHMYRSGTRWKIVSQPGLPDWISGQEDCLSEVICRELSTHEIYMIAPGPQSHWYLGRLLHVFGIN